jgi:Protein of unknown function (DUF3489)
LKTYSNRSNALRAAKAAGYQPNHVTIVVEGDGFAFQPISGTAAPASRSLNAEAAKAPVQPKPVNRPKLSTGQAKALGSGTRAKGNGRAVKSKGKPGKGGGAKANVVERMLRRRGGASVPDLIKVTGWQAHTLRARISVSARKNCWKLTRKRKSGITTYRLGA